MRCEHCPVTPGLDCLGEAVRPLCRDVAAGMPGRAAQLVAIAEADASGVAPRAAPPSPLAIRLAMDAELCPCGTGHCGCGTGPPRTCSRPGRPLEVRRADCLACVAGDWWDAGVDPAR